MSQVVWMRSARKGLSGDSWGNHSQVDSTGSTRFFDAAQVAQPDFNRLSQSGLCRECYRPGYGFHLIVGVRKAN
jgi:hypothetical protein